MWWTALRTTSIALTLFLFASAEAFAAEVSRTAAMLLEAWEDSNAPIFVSACVTKDDPHADDGVRYGIVISGQFGTFLQIEGNDVQERSGIRYDLEEKQFRLADPLGGMWSISFIADVVNALSPGPYLPMKTLTEKQISEIADQTVCNIAYVSLHLYDRFYEHVDQWTGETVEVDHVPRQTLDQSVLKKLKGWRSESGTPWNTAVYEPDLTLWGQYNHSVRLGIAGLLTTNESWNRLVGIATKAGEEEGISALEWGRRHISHLASLSDRLLFWECFAWYTSPHYVEGSLPEAAEELLARMAEANHLAKEETSDDKLGFWTEEVPLAERLPSIMESLEQARKRPRPDENEDELPVAGFDVRYFLDHIKLERQRASVPELR